MRVLILGGDGYLGWPTAMHLARAGHEVCAVDNYLRRTMALQTRSEPLFPTPSLPARAEQFAALSGHRIDVRVGDCADPAFLARVVEEFQPDGVVHYAEQPSAPYSMIGFDEARLTLRNNLDVTFNLIWSVLRHAPDCHIVKLGTMGEYGTPDIDIEEGWIDIEHRGRKDRFLFPRAAGSLYHTTKVLDTDLLWFYTRIYGIRVTDLMQGPVYGLCVEDVDLPDALLPNFHYDDIFGTLVNRFLVQAVSGVPLTVYGQGNQRRGYLNLKDTMQCVELALAHPVERGKLRILNQFTEVFSVNELAERVARVGRDQGMDVKIEHIQNPRKEKEDHYYNPAHSGLLELGLRPHPIDDETVTGMLGTVGRYADRIDTQKIHPRVRWS